MNRNTTAIILLVLSAGIYFTFTRGLIAEAKAVQVVNEQYISAIKNAEQLIKVREQVLNAYNNISEEDRQRLDKMIPNTVDNIRLIIDLNSVAVRHGFSLRNIQAETTEGPRTPAAVSQANQSQAGEISTPTLDTVTVSFGVNAPYLEFISFMQDLEANLRIMDISSLRLTPNDGGSYDFEVTLKTYWLRQ
jgi:Tfp pilus assembly protein PilO